MLYKYTVAVCKAGSCQNISNYRLRRNLNFYDPLQPEEHWKWLLSSLVQSQLASKTYWVSLRRLLSGNHLSLFIFIWPGHLSYPLFLDPKHSHEPWILEYFTPVVQILLFQSPPSSFCRWSILTPASNNRRGNSREHMRLPPFSAPHQRYFQIFATWHPHLFFGDVKMTYESPVQKLEFTLPSFTRDLKQLNQCCNSDLIKFSKIKTVIGLLELSELHQALVGPNAFECNFYSCKVVFLIYESLQNCESGRLVTGIARWFKIVKGILPEYGSHATPFLEWCLIIFPMIEQVNQVLIKFVGGSFTEKYVGCFTSLSCTERCLLFHLETLYLGLLGIEMCRINVPRATPALRSYFFFVRKLNPWNKSPLAPGVYWFNFDAPCYLLSLVANI